jgi:hypothetical protein
MFLPCMLMSTELARDRATADRIGFQKFLMMIRCMTELSVLTLYTYVAMLARCLPYPLELACLEPIVTNSIQPVSNIQQAA